MSKADYATETRQQRRERYLQSAKDALGHANACPSSDTRTTYLDLAQSWVRLADHIAMEPPEIR